MTNLGDFGDRISGVSLGCLDDVLFAGEPSSNGDEKRMS